MKPKSGEPSLKLPTTSSPGTANKSRRASEVSPSHVRALEVANKAPLNRAVTTGMTPLAKGASSGDSLERGEVIEE